MLLSSTGKLHPTYTFYKEGKAGIMKTCNSSIEIAHNISFVIINLPNLLTYLPSVFIKLIFKINVSVASFLLLWCQSLEEAMNSEIVSQILEHMPLFYVVRCYVNFCHTQ